MRSIIPILAVVVAGDCLAATRLYTRATAPATCTIGDLWTDTDGTAGEKFYICEATNTWVRQVGYGTSSNPSFNSVHASGGNLAAANKQVTKAWQSGLGYTADVTSVIHGGKHWIAKTTHTAGSTTEPGVGASYADAWTEVSGAGDDLGDATSSTIIALFGSGSCSGYLKSDGSCDTPSGAAHDAVTLGTDADVLLGLSTQQITLDSQTANTFFAAPNGSAGDPTFRVIADADIPSAIARDSELPTDATITTTDVTTNNASTTKHGWLLKATAPSSGLRNIVAIDNGETVYKNAALFDATSPSTQAFGDAAAVGTAMTSARRDHKHAMPAAPTTITGNAGTATALAANGTNCSAGQAALGVDASGNAEGCWTPSGASAAGSDTQVQFNDGGTSFGGDAGLTYNKTTDSLTVAGTVTAGNYASNCAGTGDCYAKLPNNSSAPAAATVVNGFYTYGNELYGVENSGTASKLLMANDIGVSGGAQGYDADLAALAAPTAWRLYYSNGSSAQTALAFGTANTFMISGGASSAPSFYDMTTSINSGAPNGTGAKVHWSQLTGVPAGFADGSDDGTGGGITHATSDGTYYASRNGAWSAFTSGNYTLGMTLTGNTAVTLPTSGTLITSDSTVTKTNLTLDVEGTGNSITIVDKVWFAAAGCNNATATSFYDLPTTNAPAAACITGTNTQKGVLDFDAATAESAQVSLALPSDWTGAIDVKYKWLSAATSGNVVWAVQTSCVADAETDDPSWNTASTVTDAAKGTTLQTNDASITSVTATGCAAGELLHLKFYRDAANGSDTMTGDARLIGAEVTLRRAQ